MVRPTEFIPKKRGRPLKEFGLPALPGAWAAGATT